MTTSRTPNNSSHFSGLFRVIIFNWPLYVVAIVFILALFAISQIAGPNATISQAALILSFILTLQVSASLMASHWIYDLSPLNNWSWIKKTFIEPQHILIVHAGYDETDGALYKLFPSSRISMIDLYPALEHREPSIIKAQKLFPSNVSPLSTSLTGWPVKDNSMDLILIAFAAHEVRDSAKRVDLFAESRRVLKSSGKIILVEHVQDLANFLAYNIGAFHFLKSSDWIKCIESANLVIQSQFRITPFVRVFELCR